MHAALHANNSCHACCLTCKSFSPGMVVEVIAAKPADALLAVHVVKKSPSGTAKGRWRPACVAKGMAGALDKCKEELLRPAMERNDTSSWF